MANPYNSDVGQQNKSGGSGKKDKRNSASSPSLPFKVGPTGQAPGPVKDSIGSKGYPKAKIYTQSKGI